MKRSSVAAAGVSCLAVLCVGAWLGYGTHFPPPPPPADSESAQREGGAHLDAGLCIVTDDARTCDCCFTTDNAIRCTVGVAPPDAGVLTMPRCRGGK